MKLGYDGDNEFLNYYSFSNDPSQDAPDAGILYTFKNREWSVTEEGDISYEQFWEYMGAGWGDAGVTGYITVEDAIAQLKITTGKTYTIG